MTKDQLSQEAADALSAQAATIAEQAADIARLAATLTATNREIEALRADAERLNALLSYASAWAGSAGHGDDCFVSDHYEGDPGDRCNCGLDGLMSALHDAAMQPGKAVTP